MNRKQYLLYRFAWTITGAWAALTGIFLVYALAPDPNQYCMGDGCREPYRAARNYGEPLLDRYLTWMESFVTLDLGTTVRGQPVADVLAQSSAVTLKYLVPAVVIAVLVGVGVGTFVAMHPENRLLRLVRSSSYVGFAIPTFAAAEGLFLLAQHYGWYNVKVDPPMAFPAVVLAVNLLAVQLRYAHSESIEILQEDFIRTLRATGAGTTDFAKHVFKNSASSLLSMFFSELVGVIFVVVVVVEAVFGIPGYGLMLFSGIKGRDPAIILSATVFPILLVLFGNLLQDVVYTIVDPRVEAE